MAGRRSYKQRSYAVGTPTHAADTRQTHPGTASGLRWREPAQYPELGDRATYPHEDALRRLIATFLERGIFTPGREHEEAEDLWSQVRQDAPRGLAPFDVRWFERLAGKQRTQERSSNTSDTRDTLHDAELDSQAQLASRDGPSLVDWGEALEVSFPVRS